MFSCSAHLKCEQHSWMTHVNRDFNSTLIDKAQHLLCFKYDIVQYVTVANNKITIYNNNLELILDLTLKQKHLFLNTVC